MEKDQFIATLQQIKQIIDQSLEKSEQQPKSKERPSRDKRLPALKTPVSIDFDKPIHPFIKEYGKDMSGPQRFTLLLARIVKGDLKKEVQLKELEKQWNKMKRLMDGMEFNRFFASQAKDRDWVETSKRGFYNLRPNWKKIFQ
jgi:hypothetical protein